MRTLWIAALAAITATVGFAGNARADTPANPKAIPANPPAILSDPQAIFDSARKAWAFTSYAHYANYAVAVHYTNGSATITRHYDTLEDLRRNIVFAHTFSHEEIAHPDTPSGTNVGMLGMTMNVAQDDDPIGPLALSVNYDFGISLSNRPTQVLQMGSQVNSPDRFPVIGRAGAVAKTYNVRLIEMLDDGKTYHLALTPVKDPNRNRLREMWVSAGTFITQKILISANFSKAPFTDVAWLVTFRQIDGGPYIADEKAQGPLDFGEAGKLENVTVSFENITSTSTVPAYGSVGINGDPDDGPTQFVTEP